MITDLFLRGSLEAQEIKRVFVAALRECDEYMKTAKNRSRSEEPECRKTYEGLRLKDVYHLITYKLQSRSPHRNPT